MAGQLGLKRIEISRHKVSLAEKERTCGRLFLDSGAFGLYSRYVIPKLGRADRYDWFAKEGKLTKKFRRYLDEFAVFVLEHRDGLDHYTTVDVIRNPQLSWESIRYLENKGLKPLPVIHANTDLKWVDKYIEAGHKYIGIGGMGRESTQQTYMKWVDGLYKHICPRPSRLPIVKTHGFAMTSLELLLRYPWYSVDSSRWSKAAGYSSILVPRRYDGEFIMSDMFLVCFSHRQESLARTGPHISKLGRNEIDNVVAWLDEIKVPLGPPPKDINWITGRSNLQSKNDKRPKYGVFTQYHARATANLRYFERLARWLPEWPWSFKAFIPRGLFKR